ncbi:hypothetical protein AB1K70_09580 [Bremerella sp. JC770]|uniref:hypothetical protein n=1 Tax=Bremerella sp. JC770 TaxID=3232137 RepID=UPI00345919F7
MKRSLTLIALLLVGLAPVPSFAHSLWVLVPQGEDKVVKLWYSDGPEPGRASMIHRVLETKVFLANPGSDPIAIPMKHIELSEETAEMSANLPKPAALLSAICDIGVKESRRRKPSPEAEAAKAEGGTERPARERKEEPPTREWYFCKYATSQAIQAQDAEKASEQTSARLDLVPRLEGDTLYLSASLDGKPAKQLNISITDASGQRQRLSTDENGKAKLEGISTGRYAVRGKLVLDEAGEVNGKPYTKTALVSSLILDVE